MGVYVVNFRSVSFFVWPGDVTHINTYTNIRVNLGISSTGCSPHVDFDILANKKSPNAFNCPRGFDEVGGCGNDG